MGISQLKINFIGYFIIAIIFSSCNFKKPVNKIDINKQLDIAAKSAFERHSHVLSFPLCDILPGNDWDSILVIGPYSNEESFVNINIQNFDAVKDSLLSVSYNDGKCTLAYIKSKNVIGYSIISRAPIDFCMYNQNIYLIKRSACDLLELKKSAKKYRYKKHRYNKGQ